MTGKKIKEKVKLILLNIGFILLSFLTLIPILYAFSISISGSNSIISTEFHILPKTITMDNYITILTERPFGRWFVNSLLLSALTVLPNYAWWLCRLRMYFPECGLPDERGLYIFYWC